MSSDPLNSTQAPPDPVWKVLVEFDLPHQAGSDRLAGERVVAALKALRLSPAHLERLKTAIADAVLNIADPDQPQPEWSIYIRILIAEPALPKEEPGQRSIPASQIPDTTVVSVAEQSVGRGWGFFLIHKEALEQTHPPDCCYLIELFLYREMI